MNKSTFMVIQTGKQLAPVIIIFAVAILGTIIFYSFRVKPDLALQGALPTFTMPDTLETENVPDDIIISEIEKLSPRSRFEAANRLLTLSAMFARTGAKENAVKYFLDAYLIAGPDVFKALSEPDLKIIQSDPRIIQRMIMDVPDTPADSDKNDKEKPHEQDSPVE